MDIETNNITVHRFVISLPPHPHITHTHTHTHRFPCGRLKTVESVKHKSQRKSELVEAVLQVCVWILPQRERERENSNRNLKTLFYKDCSLGSVKNLSNN